MKEITNIVIYYTTDEKGEKIVKSCIFYNDGSIKEGSKEDGITAIHKLAILKGIKIKDELRKMINKDTFYTLSEKEFKERFNSFLPQKLDTKKYSEELNAAVDKLKKFDMSDIKKTEDKKDLISSNDNEVDNNSNVDVNEDINDNYEVVKEEEINEDSSYDDFSLKHAKELEDPELADSEEKNNIFKKVKENIIKKTTIIKEKDTSKAVKTIAGLLVIVVGAIGLGHVLKRCSKEGTMTNSNITTTTAITPTPTNQIYNTIKDNADKSSYTVQSNDLYNDYNFTQLLDVTNNDFQKTSMINVTSTLTGFNSIFAKKYVESGHDIKAALSFDEVVALQQAYNNYSTDQIRAYFNGYEVNAVSMSNDYKNASLQLMGAYIIEDKENPVDMSILIDSQEGKDFYNRYHNMFMAAKYAEGEEQLKLVNDFYKAVREDFPITEEERTEGISHSESHSKIKDYQLSVAPMISAAEMIFQNLDTDYTLNDVEIDFINDIGLCNHADDKFERIETIMLGAYEDDTNPLYEQYRKSIIDDLIKKDEYVIDDAHRELSNLRRFQQIVNNDPLWKHRNGKYNGDDSKTNTTTSTTTKTWSETTTTEKTVTTTTTAPIPSDKQKEVDDNIDKENEEARQKALEEAERERQRQQQEEDQKAKDLEKEIEEENKQNQENLNNANIDDEYKDKDGNIDSYVKNITTNGSGANEDLPDPNKTGEKFDKQNSVISTASESTSSKKNVETINVSEGRAEIEYDQEYLDYDANGIPTKGKTRKLVKVKEI